MWRRHAPLWPPTLTQMRRRRVVQDVLPVSADKKASRVLAPVAGAGVTTGEGGGGYCIIHGRYDMSAG